MRATLLCCLSLTMAAAAQRPVPPVLSLAVDPKSRMLLVPPALPPRPPVGVG